MTKTHGGSESKGKRKTLRPLETGKPIHLVQTYGCQIYHEHRFVSETLFAVAKKFGVSVLDYAVAMDHLHLVFRIQSREAYVRFIRLFCSLLAKKLGKKISQSLFTRVAEWGRDWGNLVIYMIKNRTEAAHEFRTGKKIRLKRWKKGERPPWG